MGANTAFLIGLILPRGNPTYQNTTLTSDKLSMCNNWKKCLTFFLFATLCIDGLIAAAPKQKIKYKYRYSGTNKTRTKFFIQCRPHCKYKRGTKISVKWVRYSGKVEGLTGIVRGRSKSRRKLIVKFLEFKERTTSYPPSKRTLRVNKFKPPVEKKVEEKEEPKEEEENKEEEKEEKTQEESKEQEPKVIPESGLDLAFGLAYSNIPKVYDLEAHFRFAFFEFPLYWEVGVIPEFTISPARSIIPILRTDLRWDFEFKAWRIGIFAGAKFSYFAFVIDGNTAYYASNFHWEWDAGGIVGMGPPDFYFHIRGSRRATTLGISKTF